MSDEYLDDEIDVSFYKSSGPGGQKKNVTLSAVRVRHRPTGIIVVSTRARSQLRNRELALEELARRLRESRKRPKARRPTRPSRAAKTRRLEAKKKRGAAKKLRGRIDWD